MAMNIHVLSKDLIKPSLQTPSRLANLKLSFLDQMAPPHYIPIIFFYPSESENSEVDNSVTERERYSRGLKQSLSEILSIFYPLAGRLSDDGVSVDCNDAGVEYVESRVGGQLISEIIENPVMEELGKFLPINPYDHTNNVVLLAIQVNFFACGGLAIAVCMHHKLGDGSSMAFFIKSWASQSLGKTKDISKPDFHSACKLFPPIDLHGFSSLSGFTQERVITKRLVFDEIKLSRLRKSMTTVNVTPTRVESVSAFIWKKLMQMCETEKIHIGTHAMNLRSKTSPPLGDAAFGNIYCALTAVCPSDKHEKAVEKLRDAIKGIDKDYVKRLEDGRAYMEIYKKMNEEFAKGGGNAEFYVFTSWCRFPFYEVDYGWGKPAWVCIPTIPLKNFIVLLSTRDGEGIEAWVSLVEANMATLETEHGLL